MRLIDADALFNEIKTREDESDMPALWYNGVAFARWFIFHAPTIEAEPEDKWIPCSEKLPEKGHYYLWCSDMGNVQSDYYWDGFENGMKYGYNIVAWMPLPKPYRKGGNDDETD